jgi:hypothetical protein
VSVVLCNPFKERPQADRLARIRLWGAFVISVAHKTLVMQYTGQCHCGAIRLEFETSKPLMPRNCQCGFCRKRGARTVSDPEGSALLALGPETLRYRFGTGTTDFLICGRCGVYVGAAADFDGQLYVTLNLNAFDDPRLDLEGMPISYDDEDAIGKANRRRVKWTPARIVDP